MIAGLLATVAGLEWLGPWNVPSEIAMLSLAMGMMNPALSTIGAESVSLTFMTGMLIRIGGHLAAAAGRKPLTVGQELATAFWFTIFYEADIAATKSKT